MKKRIFKFQLLIATLAIISSVPSFAGDAAAGKEKAALCLTCHGEGNTVVGVGTPIISGQYRDYLVHAMKSYRSGARNNAIMVGFSSNLTDKDIEDIAAFYSEMDSQLFTPIE
ncbi:MAG: cytochrome c [Gammaproteobacteria bacterium]|nr:cytochrome c [Gammaproteobacteria bacterium]